jgi:ATP-binding cassette, subfamily F, member 3
MESREALIEALTAYSGAVILVSHDMHLLSHVADGLWLVKDGRVAPWDGDLEDYRRMLLDVPAPKSGKKSREAAASRHDIAQLRQAVSDAESRVSKLSEMREKLAAKLADPAIYEETRLKEAEGWQRKFAEVEHGLERAEALWLKALERLEQTGT